MTTSDMLVHSSTLLQNVKILQRIKNGQMLNLELLTPRWVKGDCCQYSCHIFSMANIWTLAVPSADYAIKVIRMWLSWRNRLPPFKGTKELIEELFIKKWDWLACRNSSCSLIGWQEMHQLISQLCNRCNKTAIRWKWFLFKTKDMVLVFPENVQHWCL